MTPLLLGLFLSLVYIAAGLGILTQESQVVVRADVAATSTRRQRGKEQGTGSAIQHTAGLRRLAAHVCLQGRHGHGTRS